MDITTNYYRYTVKNLIHNVENTSTTSDLRYELVTSKGEIITPTKFVPAGKSTPVDLVKEDIYQILLKTGDGEDHVIHVNYFPSLKELTMQSMREYICDCSKLDTIGCGNGQNPTIADNRELQFLISSTNLYMSTLLTPQFARHYICCLNNMINSDNRIIALMQKSVESTELHGKLPDNTHLLRLYSVYYYLLFYVIEKDFATMVIEPDSGSTGGGNTNPDDPTKDSSTTIDDLDYINSLFVLDEIRGCTVDLNMDIDGILISLTECYESKPLGLCTVTEIDPGEPTDPDPDPEDGDISNLMYQDYEPVVPIGTVVNPNIFSWDVNNTPLNLVLDDGGYGEITQLETAGSSQSVTGKSYVKNDRGTVTWTLSGSNVETIELMTRWANPTYIGKRSSHLSNKVTATEVLSNANYEIFDDLASGVEVKLNNSVGEVTYIVVAKDEHSKYTNWKNLDDPTGLDQSTIGSESQLQFITAYDNEITINDKAYIVYIMTWTGNFVYNLKLS